MNELTATKCGTGILPVHHGQSLPRACRGDGRATKWFKAVLLFGMLLFAFYASTHMVAAGDTWVALACGRHFANHGVDTVEPFSFNSHKTGPSDEQLAKFPEWSRGIIRTIHPTGWINQNWLTHLIFYKLVTWFGGGDNYNYNTLVYWKFAIYIITVLLTYAVGKILGAGDTLSALAACFAMVVGRSFYDIRPAGYSNMLTPAFILILTLAMYKNYRLIWLMVPLIVFWANVHGGYIYAFIMFVPFIGINLLLRLPRRWSLGLGFIGLGAVLYLMSHQFITHEYYVSVQKILPSYTPRDVSLLNNKMFGIWVFLTIVSLALTITEKIPSGLFYAYHFAAGAIYFLSLFVRFLPAHPANLASPFEKIYSYFVSSGQLSFIFVFAVGVFLISVMAFKSDTFIALPTKGIYHTIAAGTAALLAMIIFNPFHLTNLTHTFEISVSKHAESWRQVNEWKPAFDWMDKTAATPNPVGDEEAFAVLCILTLAVFIVWLAAYMLQPRLNKKPAKAKMAGTDSRSLTAKQSLTVPPDTFAWPKINLALLVIAFLTIYMAVRSRRFIAIAGAAACPIIALLILQAWQMITAKIRHHKAGQLKIWDIPAIGQYIARGLMTLAIVGLAIFWGWKYKRIYLDPWPTEPHYNSVFMRMTASHLKPMDVCEFIRMNKLSGKVFNYWTEGGAAAFGQEPDPQTGKIPLQLFMDGRAQAAYNHDKFRLWQAIYSGGPVAQQALLGGRLPSGKELKNIGQWIQEQLGNGVWVVLLPISQEDSVFIKALYTTGIWKTAYLDNVQHLLVNIETPQGQTLISQILHDASMFPNQYSKDLTTFSAIAENNFTDRTKDLYPLAKDAFAIFPFPAAVSNLMKLQGNPEQKKAVYDDLANYLTDFDQKKDLYKKQDGYQQRLVTAGLCAQFMEKEDPAEKKKYQSWARQFKEEAETIGRSRIW